MNDKVFVSQQLISLLKVIPAYSGFPSIKDIDQVCFVEYYLKLFSCI